MSQEITDKDGKSNWDKVHDAMERQANEGKLIDKPIVEKARDSLGGTSGAARDHIDSRPEKIERAVREQTGE